MPNMKWRQDIMLIEKNSKYDLGPEDPSGWRGTWREDWRIMGQEGYLLNKELEYRKFDREIAVDDFIQCEFCWDTFDDDPNNPHDAYYEPETKVWVCEKCFSDFYKRFHWSVKIVQKKQNRDAIQNPQGRNCYHNSYKGVYYNEQTGECWHPDLKCPEPIGPHWDYNYKGSGTSGWRVYKNNQIVERFKNKKQTEE